ncbi:OLC1v1015175C1 [Oldenlandia corymbosa var. corymbosa]|uniref:OLC1v1015175C1 n=1 Tax=Oldenlandia corymbosa var. corymbosa TaxID=529605 RepID=A0AAV1E2T5_OLDCO|nr:OLC1v1015175C1 [Oldenlandia corymbosa var. corymbosa]
MHARNQDGGSNLAVINSEWQHYPNDRRVDVLTFPFKSSIRASTQLHSTEYSPAGHSTWWELIVAQRCAKKGTCYNGPVLHCIILCCKLLSKFKEHEQVEGRKPSVAEALKWLAKALRPYKKEPPLSVLLAIAVWNHNWRRACIGCMHAYGEVVEGDILAIGSGSVEAELEAESGVRLLGRGKIQMLSVPLVAELCKGAICRAAAVAPHYGAVASGMFFVLLATVFLAC